LSTRSFFAVDGGLPLALAGASAHHRWPAPIRSCTATRPCAGSSSEYVKNALEPLMTSRSGRSRTRVIAAGDVAL
jgi:hypothetical protein